MAVITNNTASPHARLRSVPGEAVSWRPGFWGQRFQQTREVTLPHLWQLMDDPNTGHALTNLRIAAGDEQGEFAGTHWQDEWVYKWIEAASYVFAQTKDAWLDERMDEAIDLIARAQEQDGYIATQIRVRGWPRFQNKSHHEVYVMGHLLSAACAHFRATGKTTFLDVARKVGDFLHRTFYPKPAPELAHIVFNPSHIMGLVELYRTTGEQKYLDAANACIDMFGAEPGGTDQTQDRVPLREETQVVGHQVLGTYLYAGAADAYLETGDETLLAALDRLWDDMTQRRMYVHGGVCAVHRGHSIRPRAVLARTSPGAPILNTLGARPTQPDGYPGHLVNRHTDDVHEAAGDDYDLPSTTGYNETCAQIGNVLWNWRLLETRAEARYAALIERTLYNSVISGIGIDGKSWFYTNPLRFHGAEHKLLSQDAYERFQPGRVHVCCPSNLVRAMAGVHGYVYAVSDSDLWVNLYGASTFDGDLPAGRHLRVTQETTYPWDGTVTFTVEDTPARDWTLRLRIPEWAHGATLTVNGEPVGPSGSGAASGASGAGAVLEAGTYAPLQRRWQAGDTVRLDLPMRVRLLEGHPRVEATRNHVAVHRGPLLYCLESPDLPAGVSLSEIYLPRDVRFQPVERPDLLGGVTVLEGEAHRVPAGNWEGQLYRELTPASGRPETVRVTLIPYYAWANRGVSEMSAWLPLSAWR